ncbi:hypothetical protein H5410_012674 [Solanum commersonii]|uniref:Uncharacterized protein n=1 Tax=Solanum commersonii TaxID=4109 RepID=A0A9J6AS88_SOLCO|nr:hypothetical protein H5410_012674 [Solanum commersonii]
MHSRTLSTPTHSINSTEIVTSLALLISLSVAGRLTDGPYTSYDLNSLLEATVGEQRAVLIGQD